MFRNNLFGQLPDWFWKCGIGDFPLHITNAQHGQIGFLDEAMSVYRRNSGGLHGGNKASQNLERLLETYATIGTNLNLKQRLSFRIGVSKWRIDLCRAYHKEGDLKKTIVAGLLAQLNCLASF